MCTRAPVSLAPVRVVGIIFNCYLMLVHHWMLHGGVLCQGTALLWNQFVGLDAQTLTVGSNNVLAAELHQASSTPSSFIFWVRIIFAALTCVSAARVGAVGRGARVSCVSRVVVVHSRLPCTAATSLPTHARAHTRLCTVTFVDNIDTVVVTMVTAR